MRVIRVVLLALIVLIAGLVCIASLSAKTATVSLSGSSENYSELADAALSDYEANAANTDNVYQQQVVAAWGAKDLLTVVARQNAQMIDNQDLLLQAQSAQIANQSNLLGLLKALIIVGGLIVAAVAVVGATLLDRRAQPSTGVTPPSSAPSSAVS